MAIIAGIEPENLTDVEIRKRWSKDRNFSDGQFTLHFEVLFDYGFLEAKPVNEPPRTFNDLMSDTGNHQERALIMTRAGRDFLNAS